jgi:PKD repeat protein
VCTFDASASSDSDGDISSYRWDFGDTTESMLAVSNHTYGVADTYTVRLTVTDGEGATDTSSKTVTVTDSTEPPANITLDGERTNRGRTVTLSWSGASGSSVDVYINGSLNGPIANTGGASYSVNKRRSYTFEICETNSRDRCSSPLVL